MKLPSEEKIWMNYYPKEIHIMKERPFFHFKTARKLLIKDILYLPK